MGSLCQQRLARVFFSPLLPLVIYFLKVGNCNTLSIPYLWRWLVTMVLEAAGVLPVVSIVELELSRLDSGEFESKSSLGLGHVLDSGLSLVVMVFTVQRMLAANFCC